MVVVGLVVGTGLAGSLAGLARLAIVGAGAVTVAALLHLPLLAALLGDRTVDSLVEPTSWPVHGLGPAAMFRLETGDFGLGRLGLVLLVVAWRWRGSGRSRLATMALVGAALVPMVLQRPSPNHLKFVGAWTVAVCVVAIAAPLGALTGRPSGRGTGQTRLHSSKMCGSRRNRHDSGLGAVQQCNT